MKGNLSYTQKALTALNPLNMKDYLFLKYANFLGYSFEVQETEQNDSMHLTDFPPEVKKTIFATYKDKIAGVVQVNEAQLPVGIYKEMGFDSPSKKGKASRSLISYFFIGKEEGLRSDIVSIGLLLKIKQYAHKKGNKFCIGFFYDSYEKELCCKNLKWFNLNRDSFKKCNNEIKQLIKTNFNFHINLEDSFISNLNQPLINLKLFSRRPEVSLSVTKRVTTADLG